MNLREMQATIDSWIAQNGGYWSELSLLARLSEEVGEVSREYNHQFGGKRKKSSEADSSIEAELADVMWIVLCMANQQGIDLQDAFQATMDKITVRDAGRFVEGSDGG